MFGPECGSRLVYIARRSDYVKGIILLEFSAI
jgi:hypothetical protein